MKKIVLSTSISSEAQAIEQYIERYDEVLSDMRIATLKEGKNHQDILKEYGLLSD